MGRLVKITTYESKKLKIISREKDARRTRTPSNIE